LQPPSILDIPNVHDCCRKHCACQGLDLGAGVAGLQAIATARRLGAVVEAVDTRPAVKEEVMSLGAKFIEVEGAADASQAGGYAVEQSEEFKAKQTARIAESAAKADIIIATASDSRKESSDSDHSGNARFHAQRKHHH
jgi:NAD/NADP transhydrogenase alpha subunit